MTASSESEFSSPSRSRDSRRVERLCRGRGLRMTSQRLAIARILSSAADHPDAEEVHRRARRRHPTLSLATVYRAMSLFAREGILERHAFSASPRRSARFESAADEHHDHLIDVDSGRVIEFRDDRIERLQREAAARLGFRLVGHRLELYGKPLVVESEGGDS